MTSQSAANAPQSSRSDTILGLLFFASFGAAIFGGHVLFRGRSALEVLILIVTGLFAITIIYQLAKRVRNKTKPVTLYVLTGSILFIGFASGALTGIDALKVEDGSSWTEAIQEKYGWEVVPPANGDAIGQWLVNGEERHCSYSDRSNVLQCEVAKK